MPNIGFDESRRINKTISRVPFEGAATVFKLGAKQPAIINWRLKNMLGVSALDLNWLCFGGIALS